MKAKMSSASPYVSHMSDTFTVPSEVSVLSAKAAFMSLKCNLATIIIITHISEVLSAAKLVGN
jgi:hypothetical protein